MMDAPPGTDLFQAFQRRALARSGDIALAYEGRRWTYGALLRRVEAAAAGLSALGLGRGTRTAVALPNIPETVSLAYALNRIGATAVMLHPLSPRAEVEDVLARTGCRAAFCLRGDESRYAGFPDLSLISVSPAQSLGPALRLLYSLKSRGRKEPRPDPSRPARRRSMTWAQFLRRGRRAAVEARTGRPEDTALILGSGGTSGLPKYILLSNGAVNALAAMVQTLNRSTDNDGLLCLLPFFHGFGLCFCLHAGLLGGKKCVLMPQYSDRSFARTLLKEKPAYLVGVPALYERMVHNRFMGRSSLDFILGAACGGDALGAHAHQEICDFLAKRGCDRGVQMGYGLTECVTACAFTPPESFKPGRIGKPFAGIQMKIAADARTDLPPKTPGEIWISGPTLMSGYLDDPAATADALQRDADGRLWLRTGDIGLVDDEGFFVFLERTKRVIKRAGYNVFPATVESALEDHPLVVRASVVARPGRGSGARRPEPELVAFVQTDEGPGDPEPELLAYCTRVLNPFHRPARIIRLERFPLTRMKKVDTAALEKLAASL